MHSRYCEGGQKIVHPHEYPPFLRLMGTVFDAANAAGAEINFLTVSEVYDSFLQAPQISAKESRLNTFERSIDKSASLVLKPVFDQINGVAQEFISNQTAGYTVDVPGIGPYYAGRAARGETLAPYELRIAEQLLSLHPLDRVYEIGSGLSLLPALLAATGQRAIGIERDQSRVVVARELMEVLAKGLKIPSNLCELWGAAAPQALLHETGKGAGLVFTNITSTIDDADMIELVRRAAEFDVVIIDVSRFFIVRDEIAQIELLDQLAAAGWQNPTQMSRTYWCFVRDDVQSVAGEIEDETEELTT
jgi:hypothetical protein